VTVHGRYRRCLVDAAVRGHPLIVDLLVRRWRCRDLDCATITFAEQIPGLTSPHSRYTPLATEMIEAIGLALAGRSAPRPGTPTRIVLSARSTPRTLRSSAPSDRMTGVGNTRLDHMRRTTILSITHQAGQTVANRQNLPIWGIPNWRMQPIDKS
jgi:hypothetical protein